MRKQYVAIDSRGVVHRRSTQNRTYTHCVVIRFPERPGFPLAIYPPHREKIPAYHVAEWAGRPDLADRIARRYRNSTVADVEILPAELVRGGK